MDLLIHSLVWLVSLTVGVCAFAAIYAAGERLFDHVVGAGPHVDVTRAPGAVAGE